MVIPGPRKAIVTPDDHGPILQIASWFLMVSMILFTLTRLAVRFISAHTPGLDDWIVVTAMLFGTGLVISLSLAVNEGLGQRISKIQSSKLGGLQKEVYAATILYLITLCLAKLSVIAFFGRLAAVKVHQTATWLLAAFTSAWALAAILAFAFRCDLPQPWTFDRNRCFDPIVFWKSISALDILIDCCMILLPIWILWKVHIDKGKKYIVVFLFALRAAAVVAAGIRLRYLGGLYNSADPTFDSIPYMLCTVLQATVSVIVSCLPAMKPFMDQVMTGMLDFSLDTRAPGTTYGKGSYLLRTFSSKDNAVSSNPAQRTPERETESQTAGQSRELHCPPSRRSDLASIDEMDDSRSRRTAESERRIIQHEY